MRIPSLLMMGLLVLLAAPLAAVGVGDKAPNFRFTDSWNAKAGASSLNDYRGQLVLLEVWATW